MTRIYQNFTDAQKGLTAMFMRAPEVHAQRWQGIDVSQRPEAKMVELLHESFRVPLKSLTNIEHYQKDIPANYPWAEDHFQERVCGYPLNPGEQWKHWPWGNSAANFLEDGIFNHNYMERYWPKYAGNDPDEDGRYDARGAYPNFGIRYEYGDLNDLVEHLRQEPDTRQAYLPIFFPEDTGTANPSRKPCSLGYHFILRHGHFHITYYMRSCDFYQHWADDCYLTVRLLMWVFSKLHDLDPETWSTVKPGFFVMHITSLHMFVNDMRKIK